MGVVDAKGSNGPNSCCLYFPVSGPKAKYSWRRGVLFSNACGLDGFGVHHLFACVASKHRGHKQDETPRGSTSAGFDLLQYPLLMSVLQPAQLPSFLPLSRAASPLVSLLQDMCRAGESNYYCPKCLILGSRKV